MALPNPTINPPALSASRQSLHSRSPSRSPMRNARDFDPLLRDLSPTTTLRAFTSEPASVSGKHDSAVSSSFESASSSERATGARAAQACLDIRSWANELEAWEWPGTFDVAEPARKRMRVTATDTLSAGAVSSILEHDAAEYEDWGSLAAGRVLAYQARVDEIRHRLDEIDFGELKGHALSAHQQAASGPATLHDTIGMIGAATDLRRLDDFTVLVTATILQALPHLSRLHRLMETWSLRLSILRQTPSYLRDLEQARVDLEQGWAAIAVSRNPAHDSSAKFTRGTMIEMQSVIQNQVASLGRRLDAFLDGLEGREETVPASWIDDFETLERAYGEWVVQAERKILENDWLSATKDVELATMAGPRAHGQERSSSDLHTSEHTARDGDSEAPTSPRPTSGVFMSEGLTRESSEALPDKVAPGLKMSNGVNESFVSLNSKVNDSPSKRTRYRPIVIDFDEDGQKLPVTDNTIFAEAGEEAMIALNTSPPQPISRDASDSIKSGAVKKRADFLDSGIERKDGVNGLNKSKSPVRPFEHASNAFTRLFKKEKTPDVQSSKSTKRSSGSAKSKKNEKDGDEVVWGGRRPATPQTPKASKHGRKSSEQSLAKSRSPSASRRSFGRSNSKPPLPDTFGSHENDTAAPDHPDLPGEFRSRPTSQGSRRARSPTPRHEHSGEVRRLQSQHRAEKPRPSVEVYQPKRLSSPFRPPTAPREQDYPIDWPLASPPDTQSNSPVKEHASPPFDPDAIQPLLEEQEREQREAEPEIHFSTVPLETDAFDRMFVATLPTSPELWQAPADEERRASAEVTSASGSLSRITSSFSRRSEEGSRPRRTREPTLNEAMLGAEGRQDDLSVATASFIGPIPEFESSMTEDVLAPMRLAPERRSESPKDFFARSGDALQLEEKDGKEVPPESVSTENSPGATDEMKSNDDFHVRSSLEAESTASSSAAVEPGEEAGMTSSPKSPVPLKLKILGSASEHAESGVYAQRPVPIKRASFASIESHPRSSLRSINVTGSRRSSVASFVAQTLQDYTPVSALDLDNARQRAGSPLHYGRAGAIPTPPGQWLGMPQSPVSPMSDEHSPVKSRLAASPLNTFGGQDADDVTPAPLNVSMVKRRNQKSQIGTPSSVRNNRSLKPGEDSFDRHVSEVLDRLPSTSIKFKARPGALTPTARTAEARSYAITRPKAGRMSSKTGSDDMTLAPADTTPKKSSGSNESEVKLYHLTQAGREEPIKLFVRLVGEGERVMVRVGGGWADLADYLRQYAEHHGSQTISGSGLEVHTARRTPGLGNRKLSNSSMASAAEAKGRPPLTSTASDFPQPGGRFDDAPLVHQTFGTDGYMENDGSTTELSNYHQTPTSAFASQHSSPKSAPMKAGSRPSTAGSLGRPGSRQNYADVGLAGPASSKLGDLPEQKAKWVEGMLEKAKAASAEKGKEDKAKYFGDLGKAGGTRRVIFRQTSATALRNDENSKP
ncbi:hypothetical protein B0A50_01012 [Salinomyces thailandicus]|uniref:GAR domain-containing protein n=1 Tax=Salinomyces thailandicus TaxID=706561 RepID=A0A4U0UC62_9PEZI|nr:hypothetical protein B0A50_01012 [Salinomyces thailandica]